MTPHIKHELKISSPKAEAARQNFVSGLRHHLLVDMATDMKRLYDTRIEPETERKTGKKPETGSEVHKAMKPETSFKFYSAMRTNAQEMVWRSVIPSVDEHRSYLAEKAEELIESGGSTVETDPALEIPRSVTALDVHLMPGNYHTEYGEADVSAGATYDNGLSVFSMGLMGDNLDDIGSTIATFIAAKYPEFKPKRILDLGCTIGHNTVPWARTYPDAEVHAVDVAAPGLRYGAARANSQGQTIHFHQRTAEDTGFEDGSFDLVWSSMFLHELPQKTIEATMKEAHRLLKPGGLMLHMELPPNDQMSAYDGFVLDWDSWYNNEPFYKPFRDKNTVKTVETGGFSAENYVQFVIPSIGVYGKDAVLGAVEADAADMDDKVGRLADGIMWFCFGAWK